MKILSTQPEKILDEVGALCRELAAGARGKELAARLGAALLRLGDASELNFRDNLDGVLSGPAARAALTRIRNCLAGGPKGEGKKGRGGAHDAGAREAWRLAAQRAVRLAPRGDKRELRKDLGISSKSRKGKPL